MAATPGTLEGPKPAHAAQGSLLRVLGLGFGLAVIIGNTIGAGIMRTPGDVAKQLPNTWLFIGIWVLGGLYALLGSLSMAELAAAIPRSAGYFVFARRAFGEYPAFVVGWTDWMAQSGSTAAVAIVIAEYCGDLVPRLAGHKIGLASAVAIVVALLQWRGIRWGGTAQNITSTLKTLGLFGLVAAIFLLAPRDSTPTTAHLATGLPLMTAIVVALQSVIYTYDGWYGVIYFGEEVVDPGRSIPRSMFGGVLAVMAIYILMNLVLLYALPMSAIAGEKLPMAAAARSVFGAHGDTVLRLLMIVSMLSSINAYHLMASRIPHAMSEDGLVHHVMLRVNPGGTPTVGLLFSTIAAVAFILSGSFEMVAAIMAFFFVADYAMAYAAVFVLRRREPDLPRPYRALGYPWTTGLALAGSVAFLAAAIYSDLKTSLYAILVLAVSGPIYLLQRWLTRRSQG